MPQLSVHLDAGCKKNNLPLVMAVGEAVPSGYGQVSVRRRKLEGPIRGEVKDKGDWGVFRRMH